MWNKRNIIRFKWVNEYLIYLTISSQKKNTEYRLKENKIFNKKFVSRTIYEIQFFIHTISNIETEERKNNPQRKTAKYIIRRKKRTQKSLWYW